MENSGGGHKYIYHNLFYFESISSVGNEAKGLDSFS